jgi:hypothetical protein
MTNEDKMQSRRRFLGWGIASAAVFSAVKFILPSRKKEVKETVKMLTQDGKLVEVDLAALPFKKEKISDKELQNWIRK